MSQVIECPSCSKKFKLPDHPPAIFTCTQCQTPMDLSDFGGAEAPPAPPPAGRAGRGGGRGRGRAAAPERHVGYGAHSASGGRARRRGRGRSRRRGGHDEHEDEEGGYRGRGRREQNNTGLVIGAGVALIIAVIAVIAMTKDDAPEDTEVADGGGAATIDPTGMMTPNPLLPGAVPGTPMPGVPGANPAAGNPAGTNPAPGANPGVPPVKPRRSGSLSTKNIVLKVFDWPDDVSAETRGKVEEAIEWLYIGGRDATESEDYLVKEGRKICGRIISEFKSVVDAHGLDSREGMSRLMVLDRTLRRIDGYQERRWRRYEPIRHASSESHAMKGMKLWVHWWDSNEWQTEPREPWDERVDMKDDDDEKKGKGVGRRGR